VLNLGQILRKSKDIGGFCALDKETGDIIIGLDSKFVNMETVSHECMHAIQYMHAIQQIAAAPEAENNAVLIEANAIFFSAFFRTIGDRNPESILEKIGKTQGRTKHTVEAQYREYSDLLMLFDLLARGEANCDVQSVFGEIIDPSRIKRLRKPNKIGGTILSYGITLASFAYMSFDYDGERTLEELFIGATSDKERFHYNITQATVKKAAYFQDFLRRNYTT